MRLRKLRVAGMSGMPKRPMLATPTEERTYVRRLKDRIHALEALPHQALALLSYSLTPAAPRPDVGGAVFWPHQISALSGR